MRSLLRLPVLLAFSLAFSTSAFAARECAMVHKGSGWQRGKLLKAQVEERSEGGAPTDGAPARGQLLRLTVKVGAVIYFARCAVGTDGCDPAALAGVADGADEISFVILGKTDETKRLVFPRPDGHLLCAQLAPPR
jgi:hypothetical protein